MIVGVDPGAHTTGIVVRVGSRCAHAELVTNREPEITDAYLLEVCTAVGDALKIAREYGTPAVLAVEDLTHPNPHLGIANVTGLLGTAQVIGALRRSYRVVLVPPGGNGSAPLSAYPEQLVGVNEPRGTGKLRHVRSAWDVAGQARSLGAKVKQARNTG